MTKVKICGIKDDLTVRSAAKAGAEWVGFNLVPTSPRYIGQDEYERVSDKTMTCSARLPSIMSGQWFWSL
ncbi:MAG: hypothetical protein RLN72_16540, partial [Henriciella sp.]